MWHRGRRARQSIGIRRAGMLVEFTQFGPIG
jgi:hypothetical protein